MNRLLLVLIVTMFIDCPSMAKPNADSILYTQQTKRIILLDKKVDSLLKVTDKFSIEKNYFSSALSAQTTIFSVIVTIALALFGFVSYSEFASLVRKHKKETKTKIDEQNAKIDSIAESNKSQDKLISSALGNISSLVTDVFKDKKAIAFIFSIKAAKHHLQSEYLNGAVANLSTAVDIIDDPEFFDKLFATVLQFDNENMNDLKFLISSENEKVMTLALNILNKYIVYKYQYSVIKQTDL